MRMCVCVRVCMYVCFVWSMRHAGESVCVCVCMYACFVWSLGHAGEFVCVCACVHVCILCVVTRVRR